MRLASTHQKKLQNPKKQQILGAKNNLSTILLSTEQK